MKSSVLSSRGSLPQSNLPRKDIFLHIGVHKTGSTHIQGTFKVNRASLTKAGVCYLPIKECRETFTQPCIQKKLGSAERGAAFFDEILRDSQAALISDENLIGVVDSLLAGHFYPRMARNIKRIRAMAGPLRELSIYCCIRNYGDWIESAYLQTLKRSVTPFDSFIRKLNPEQLSWVRFVQDLRAAAGTAKITLWPYETYCRDSSSILDALARDFGVSFSEKLDSRPNPSLSEVAVRLLTVGEREVSKEDRPKLYKLLRANFSTNQNYSKPRFLDASLRAKLDTNYKRDLQMLCGISNVALLGFDPP